MCRLRPIFLVFFPLFLFPVPARAELKFSQTVLNLGKIKSGVPVDREFHFQVGGEEKVEIVEVRPGCGCVAVGLDGKVFAPGEKGKITLNLHTLGEAEGPHHWYLHVYYKQGKETHQVALQILADVEAEIQLQPARLNIHTSGPVTQEIRLTDTRSPPLTVLDVRSSASCLKPSVGKPFSDKLGHWTVSIQVQVEAALPEGKTEGIISIYTNDPAYGHLQMPVTVTRPTEKRCHALPAEIRMFGEKGSALPARLLQIRDAQDEPVVIERVKADHPALKCTWAKGPGSLATVKIQVDGGQFLESRLESVLRVEISRPVTETLTIPIFVDIDP